MRSRKLIVGLCAAALLAAAGCGGQRGPATEAVTTAEASLTAIRDEAARYLPTQLQDVESTLSSLKGSLARRDYEAVLAGTPDLTARVGKLQSDVAARREQIRAAEAEWAVLSTDVPKLVDAIQERVDTLSKARRLPRGIDAAKFESAKTGLELVKSTWTSATTVSAQGDSVDAVVIAKGAKTKGEEVLELLGATAG